jgi:hypothetical protein
MPEFENFAVLSHAAASYISSEQRRQGVRVNENGT